MSSRERGAVAAEFAVAAPAVVLVLGLCVGGVQAAALQVRLQDAASTAARALARGEPAEVAASAIDASVPGAALATRDDGAAVCVDVSARISLAGIGTPISVTATGCAATGGR